MTASPESYSAAPAAPVPGRVLGIVAFIVSFFASIVGLILGIVALVQSRKAGVKNGWALAAIIIGSIAVVLTIIVIIVAVVAASSLLGQCADLGPGIHELSSGVTITCN